jgi:hypothetical protein
MKCMDPIAMFNVLLVLGSVTDLKMITSYICESEWWVCDTRGKAAVELLEVQIK